MHPVDIIQLIGVGTVSAATLIVVIGATVRFVFNPLIKARRLAASASAASAADSSQLNARIDTLEEEMRRLGEALERVAAAAEFDAQLRAGAASAPQLPRAEGGS